MNRLKDLLVEGLIWLVALPFLLVFGRGGLGGSGKAKPPPPPPPDKG